MSKRSFVSPDQEQRVTRLRLREQFEASGFSSAEEKLNAETALSEEAAHQWMPPSQVIKPLDRHEAPGVYTKISKTVLPYTGNGSLRYGSLVSVLEALKLTRESVFCDLGCGPGNVLVCALMNFGVLGAFGVEIDEPTLSSGRVVATAALASHDIETDRLQMLHGDLQQWQTLPKCITHVFAYDRVMPESVLRNVARMLNLLKPTGFISFQKPQVWQTLGLQANCVEKVRKCSTTGSQTFTGYRFEF